MSWPISPSPASFTHTSPNEYLPFVAGCDVVYSLLVLWPACSLIDAVVWQILTQVRVGSYTATDVRVGYKHVIRIGHDRGGCSSTKNCLASNLCSPQCGTRFRLFETPIITSHGRHRKSSLVGRIQVISCWEKHWWVVNIDGEICEAVLRASRRANPTF